MADVCMRGKALHGHRENKPTALDETGRPCPISLGQVGREVTRERIVLRIDRRQHED